MEYKTKSLLEELNHVLDNSEKVIINPRREYTITKSIDRGEAIKTEHGCVATWSPDNSTGRSPADTYIVDSLEVHNTIDWKSKSNKPLSSDTFCRLYDNALEILSTKKEIYVTNRAIGADEGYALQVDTISSSPLVSLFTYNMFRDIPDGIEDSVFNGEFKIIVLPYDKIDSNKYPGLLNNNSSMVIATDFTKRVGIVIGSSYLGTVKKLAFTAMNFYLPHHNILPLHCSANVDDKGNVSIFLGLSGTGKTTLSTEPTRKLLGDDEHGWSDNGVYNFENGCYVKTLNLTEEREPEIYRALFEEKNHLKNGAILENTMVYPNGRVDLSDERLSVNGRASYPLNVLENAQSASKAGHPRTILFLTADACGVLPPISKLEIDQAKLWFLMGYTSKIPGTESGITEPIATFSRFFGEPFMPSRPSIYMKLLGDKMEKYNTNVYLLNTGWIGGVYGKGGERISLKYTRAMVRAANEGLLENVEFERENYFDLSIPKNCPGVPSQILNPVKSWEDKGAYEKEARKLADKFASHFKNDFGTHPIDKKIIAFCPGL
ncbi:phosphoenolpyruvate carboxykinase (ATP) [Balneicella halophila]|uniref:Phosphoenolpyruvate carboxykinase (ATP) n=1 Tax=Balneicella halophila TaxID=1537566 RepID=A0A7L4UNY0_BALHA|nr:phosphoenolpyruvate carboxykinase (ATP) [Balneicella halophila]PVX50823.1 phosphoenolpyruvate carboxykinase (ATP) [Balneicella halophila]